MSLLIKALQKAEDEKISDGKTGASAGELSLEPKSSEIGLTHQATTTGKESAASSRPQQAAAGVFSAKLPLNTHSESKKKILLIVVASFLLLLLIGMQVYSYIDSLNQSSQLVPRPNSTIQSSPQLPIESQHQVVSEADGATRVFPAPEEQVAPTENTAALPSVEKPVTELAMAIEETPEPAAPAPENKRSQPVKSREVIMGDPVAVPSAGEVKVTRNVVEMGINPDLAIAYQAFTMGDDDKAQTHYRRVLQSDVRNTDALLGMAAIAARQGRARDAAGWYSKVLEVDPRNSIAQAALISGFAQADPIGAESRIKNLLAVKPEAAHLYAALGNLYAEREEWAQAQQAYFQAHHFAPTNADYAFNLGVSLDHLGKASLALQYYRQSLELLARSGSGNIDRAQLESRILQLQ